ncbi:MAG: phosphoribosylaminoimidazolesuccinocarboxamide synthase [Tenacibaculum sp.]
MNTIVKTNFQFPKQKSVYRGKVREVYNINDELLVVIATDRLSAFDVILPRQIPYKGQVLNQLAVKMMNKTADIVPNWLIGSPDKNVTIGHLCTPFKVEMIIRGYLSGHANREYKTGKRLLCGVELPEGMRENDRFPNPVITPSTKADKTGCDMDISKEDILAKGIVSEQDYNVLEKYTRKLFKRGTELAEQRGLILVDTKYEFGKTKSGKIVLIDEIHTPDSSRYFYAEDYKQARDRGDKPKQLSKEFVREWLLKNGFQGKKGQQIPNLSDKKVDEISKRYIELYQQITGETFVKTDMNFALNRIEKNTLSFLESKSTDSALC